MTQHLEVNWRGQLFLLTPEDRLILQGSGPTGHSVCLWEPRHDEIFQRDHWIADVYIRDFGFVQAKGETPQQALDALSAELPPGPMVRGGSC